MAANETFPAFSQGPQSPARNAEAITPDNGNDILSVTSKLYVGDTGHVTCVLAGETANTTFRNVQAGTTLNICVKAVKAAGTTAGNMVGLR